ncbi:hypothetical protein [Nonomuraea typhae]|uniref:Uncharacterized protein n=1 Tax=Nonomuraea typhae TaxID=2603600 RepID=A0ABW7YY27_9ACTN
MFRDEETEDFFFQGEEVTDKETLERLAVDSPLLATEAVVRLPSRMIDIILEACRDRELR